MFDIDRRRPHQINIITHYTLHTHTHTGIWSSYVVRTDRAGKLLWQRVDAYRAPGAADLDSKFYTPVSSAAEIDVSSSSAALHPID